LDTKVNTLWDRKKGKEFIVPLNDTVPTVSRPRKRQQSATTTASRRTSATDLTSGTSAAPSSTIYDAFVKRVTTAGPRVITPQKVSRPRLRYSRMEIVPHPESYVRGSPNNVMRGRGKGSPNRGVRTITARLAAFIKAGISEIEDEESGWTSDSSSDDSTSDSSTDSTSD
jgi:hypothetical protein